MTLALGATLAVVVAGLAAAAGNHKPVIIQEGNLKVTADGGFSPTALPKTKLTGIGLNISGKIETTDGTHPPALREFIVETDKNGTINAKGMPEACTIGKLVARETKAAEAACPNSIVGKGKTDVEVAFPEQNPLLLHSKLIAFNGGVKGGVTTILIHAFLSNPVSAAVVTTVKVSKIHKGRFGTKSVASIPVIAGGSGSPTFFELNINRKFTYKGKQQSYLLAKCPDGHINARGTAVFSDGKKLSGEIVRPCTPKG
ncbi:MAG TPA: hypothetical protein VFJ64_11355 [Solirubrobacterales bacterium]|nr:hypothetical protein [Solirubrobacterales bacterium]